MEVKVQKLPKSQLKVVVSVENSHVKNTYASVLAKKAETTVIEGFRKGHAPIEKVEQKIGVSNLYGEVINELLQKFYSQAIKENHIQPISNPKVEITEFDLEKDFTFEATVAIKPDITIKDYKGGLKKFYEDKNKLVKKENADRLKKGEKLEHDHAHVHPNELIAELIKYAQLDVPEILVEEETNRLVARFVDQIFSAGMKVEDYLKAQKTTMDELKKNYSEVAMQNIKAELVLSELIQKEQVSITDEELEANLGELDDKAREQLKDPMQRIYIRAILEKNKLITKLIKEVEGENSHAE